VSLKREEGPYDEDVEMAGVEVDDGEQQTELEPSKHKV